MFRQWQNHPIPKMMIHRDEATFLPDSALEYERIVSPRLAGFLGANDIVPLAP